MLVFPRGGSLKVEIKKVGVKYIKKSTYIDDDDLDRDDDRLLELLELLSESESILLSSLLSGFRGLSDVDLSSPSSSSSSSSE